MIELTEARQRILAAVPPLPSEILPLHQALNRFVAGDIASPINLPPFDNSAMDGFALRAGDVAGASATTPVELIVTERVAAGTTPAVAVAHGGCTQVFTGSALPPGSDAVVMQEDTRPVADRSDRVQVVVRVKPWENVRFRGEDIPEAASILQTGERISVGALALLAAVGLVDVRVGQRPRISLLATGSELLEPNGRPLPAAKIFESNRVALSAMLSAAGAACRVWPIIPDDRSLLQKTLAAALEESDAVVTTGGVSVGEFDLVKQVFGDLGGEVGFWQIAMKPGKPFVFGQRKGKLFFGLPGNPVSALVTALLLVRPAVLRWQGARETGLFTQPGVLREPLTNPGNRPHFIRVQVDETGGVGLAGVQASHILRSLAQANGLVEVPPGVTFDTQSRVNVLRW